MAPRYNLVAADTWSACRTSVFSVFFGPLQRSFGGEPDRSCRAGALEPRPRSVNRGVKPDSKLFGSIGIPTNSCVSPQLSYGSARPAGCGVGTTAAREFRGLPDIRHTNPEESVSIVVKRQ
jgi:hypothetical protein